MTKPLIGISSRPRLVKTSSGESRAYCLQHTYRDAIVHAGGIPVSLAPVPVEDGGTLGQEVGLLAKIPLFAGMERSKLKLLAFTSERQDFEEGQVLFKQGDPGDRAFVIVEGAVDVIVETADGPQVLSNPGRGDVIGELALLCEEPRTATVKANQPLTVLSISGDVFFKLIQENSEVSMALTRIVAKRLVQTMKKMA